MEPLTPRKKPRLMRKEITKEIRNRTGYSTEVISNVLKNYSEIVKETVPLGIECELPTVGFFSYRQMPPKEDITIYNPRERKFEEHKNFPGYKRMKFRCTAKWKKELKALSAVAPWEEEKEGKE